MYYFKKKKKQPLFEKDIPSIHKKVKRKTNLKAKLDKVFSLYIRLRDSKEYGYKYFKCISCGKIKPFEQGDCGHYINRQHMITRFDEMNCNIQCRKCNRFMEGNIQGYREGLIKKYGEQKVLILESRKTITRRYSDFEYETLIKYYKEEIKKMEKERDGTLEKNE